MKDKKMKNTNWKKITFVATLVFGCSAQATPGLGGIYDYWAGHVHFTDGTSRLAQGGTLQSCTNDLYVQKNSSIANGKTFSHFTYCKKSAYPKMYQLKSVAADDDRIALDELETQFNIKVYRLMVAEAKLAYEQKKVEETTRLIREKGSEELSFAELESIEAVSYFPYELKIKQLEAEFHIEEFKANVNSLRR